MQQAGQHPRDIEVGVLLGAEEVDDDDRQQEPGSCSEQGDDIVSGRVSPDLPEDAQIDRRPGSVAFLHAWNEEPQ